MQNIGTYPLSALLFQGYLESDSSQKQRFRSRKKLVGGIEIKAKAKKSESSCHTKAGNDSIQSWEG